MRRRLPLWFVYAVLIACLMLVFATRLRGARPAPLTVDVSALDATGAAVGALSAADVEVLVDGVAMPVVSVAPAPAELNLVLLIDHSLSVPVKRSELIAAIATQWVPQLGAGDRTRVALVASPIAFGPWLNTRGPQADATSMVRTLLERAGAEPSPIWDAIDASAQVLATTKSPKSVIAITDGRATGNAIGLEELAVRAAAIGVSVSSVSEADERVLPQGRDAATRVRPDASLEWLAEETGGLYLEDGIARRNIQPRADPFGYVKELMNTPTQPGLLLTKITALLRQRYLVSFAGPDDGRPHRLDVRSLKSGLTIRARRSIGFRAP